MERINLTKETFEWPPRTDFKKLKNMNLSVYRINGEEKQVKIKIRKPAWERYQSLFPLSRPPAKGWVTLNMPSNSPEWVARHFLPALGDVQILEPIVFRKAWLKEIKGIKAIYK
jgi:predicted DNA-binding transcriptional regulator YafY